MTTGVLVSWAIYFFAALAFAFFANRHLRGKHHARMADLDAAIEREENRFREEQMAWAVEDAQFRLKQADEGTKQQVEADPAVACLFL